MWIVDILRSIFFFIDNLIYTFIVTLYNLLVDIAETSIFTEEVIDLFASKVYALLGVFMLFKVSFSIISYIVNPDEFTDKTKGFGKLIGNIIITLTLLIATPWIFSQAMDIQRIILRDNILGKIFSTSDVNTQIVTDPGNTMAYETFKAFYHLNYDLYPECEGIEAGITGSNNNYPNYDEEACKSKAFSNDESFSSYKDTLQFAYATSSISIYMNSDLVNVRNQNDEYTMSYMPFISTLAGGAVGLLLIVFCFDVAVRSVKLGFLRMIAPIPIVSRIDPKKGKETFDKWVKVCVSTYLDLFIRLLAIYFAVFVITQLVDLQFVDAVTGITKDVNVFVKVFIILGALLFAKQLPKLLEDLTGMKLYGKFTLNPLKKLGEVPLAGAGAHLLAGGVDSMAHGNGFWAGVRRNRGQIPLGGGDGKTSVLATADRKMRKDIRAKADTAQQRYEGIERQRQLEEQKKLGEKYAGKDPSTIYSREFAESKKSVDVAKKTMYNWQNEVQKAQADYQAAVNGKGDVDEAYKKLVEANQNYGSAQGQYEYRKKLHDAMRQQRPRDARIEDAIEAYEKTGGKQIGDPPAITTPTTAPSPIANDTNNRTPMQERVERAANVHDEPTREEHIDKQDYYTRFFNDPAVSNYIDKVEETIDSQANTANENTDDTTNG